MVPSGALKRTRQILFHASQMAMMYRCLDIEVKFSIVYKIYNNNDNNNNNKWQWLPSYIADSHCIVHLNKICFVGSTF